MKRLHLPPQIHAGGQPPLGGCVLKQNQYIDKYLPKKPAAFRRLCVETLPYARVFVCVKPAAFRRLCVETMPYAILYGHQAQPPLGGCVLKRHLHPSTAPSLKPAAFRRLCVETCSEPSSLIAAKQPPLGGCVLKPKIVAQNFRYIGQPPLGGCVLKQSIIAARHRKIPSRL